MAHEKLQETHVGPFPPLIPFFLDFDSQYSTIFDWKPPSERIPIHDFRRSGQMMSNVCPWVTGLPPSPARILRPAQQNP